MKALLFDTETTGLPQNRLLPLDMQPEIIEISMSLVDLAKKGKVMGSYDQLIRPKIYPRSPETMKATKSMVPDSLLEKAPLFQSVATAIRKRLEEAPVVIAHNLSFDREMIEIEFERLDPAKPIAWPRCICTIESTMVLKSYRLSLTNLHKELFGKGFDEAHRARPDLDALIRCTVDLYQKGYI